MKEELLKKLVSFLIEDGDYDLKTPETYEELRKLYKALVNVREPKFISEEVLKLEDQYLKLEIEDKNVTDVQDLDELEENIILWRGDITTLKCDVIVNAGNSQGLGCFNPQHLCIDNIIHTNAGMRLRLECNEILKGSKIKTGDYIVADGYNLPCKKVITTVGPRILKNVRKEDEENLSSCYKNSLEYAIKNNFKSIAFPCISTGIFRYPKSQAKVVAYNTVKDVLKEYDTNIKVVFNVFSEEDYDEYKDLFRD